MLRPWLLLFLVFLLVGCAPKEIPYGGMPGQPPRTVVSLSPSTTEILALDGNSGQLMGRTEACNYPAFVGRTIAPFGGVKPDYERLAIAKPQLIVYDSTLYSESDKKKLEELAKSTENKKPAERIQLFEFKADTVEEYVKALRDLGQVVDAPMNMSKFVDKVNAAIGAAKSVAPAHPPKVAILDQTLIAGTKSFLADVIKICGGQLVGPDSNLFVTLNPEALIQDNPDVIIVPANVSQYQNDAAKQAEVAKVVIDKLLNDPRYKSLNAVKNKRIYPLDADVLLRKGSRVDGLIQTISTEVAEAGNS